MSENKELNPGVFDVNTHEVLPELYMTYAMSVIKDRSLPDIRDGLKPVLRRSLYAMGEMGLGKPRSHVKSAKVTGEVMANYHPHGDGCLRGNTPVYDTNGNSYEIKDLIGQQISVFSCNTETRVIETATAYAFRITKYVNELYRITFVGNGVIELTDNHQLLRHDGEWVRADEIQINDIIVDSGINDGMHGIRVVNVETFAVDNEPVYDFTVDGYENMLIPIHHYENGDRRFIVAHNSIYHTIVRLAQPWVSRYPLIDGQGNFGSPDGDDPAAMRYTEMCLLPMSKDVLEDIHEDTVDFVPNYDGTTVEPRVLPTKLPLLLLNGSIGIAVGMATTCAPHNLSEVIDATIKFIDNQDVLLDDLLLSIKGPDFPTGASMFMDNIKEIYQNGRGSVVLRAKAEVEEDGKYQTIVFTELPYQLNKTTLVSDIAKLYQENRGEIEGLDDISDIRDESDKDNGCRLVIELKKGVKAEPVINMLYRRTSLQMKYSISMMALVDGNPKYVNLIDILKNFVAHRKDVITRRTKFRLKNAEARMHILEGYVIMFNNRDKIVDDIKSSVSSDDAYEKLRKYDLSDIQIKSILDMRVQRIAQFEQQPVLDEHKKLGENILSLRALLSDDKNIYDLMRSELVEIKTKYGDERRTRIINSTSKDAELSALDEISDEDMVITVTKKGNIKKTPVSEYRVQRAKGRGAKGVEVKDDDAVEYLFNASARDYALAFTNMGKCYKLNIHQIPSSGKGSLGKQISSIIDLDSESEKIVKVVPMDDFSDREFMMVTRLGQVKKIHAEKLKRPRSGGMVSIGLNDGDNLIDVILLDKKGADILLVSKKGLSIRFPESSIRAQGRSGGGVAGISLDPGDSVVSTHFVDTTNDHQQLMTVTSKGFAKQTPLGKFRPQRRSGRGIICMETDSSIGDVIAAHVISDPNDDVLLTTSHGIMIRFELNEVKSMGRNCRGCKIQRLEDGDSVSAISVIKSDDSLVLSD